MVGFPRSGKSTATAMCRGMGVPIVEGDAIRRALHDQRFIQKAEPMVLAIMELMVDTLFISGYPVVCLDEASVTLTRKDRDKWKDLADEVKFWHIDTTESDCIARAHANNDMHIIPVIRRMAAQFEPLEDDELRLEEEFE